MEKYEICCGLLNSRNVSACNFNLPKICNLFVDFAFLLISYPDHFNTFYKILTTIIKGLKRETTQTGVFSDKDLAKCKQQSDPHQHTSVADIF